MTFLSVGIRFEANVEALNAVETTGNYSKHRRVPYLFYSPRDQEFKVIYVPALSGESLAHAYQEALVEEAKAVYGGSAPVCEECARGEFFKSMSDEYVKKKLAAVFSGSKPEDLLNDPVKVEEAILKSCLVEDIGGFLYAGKIPVKRTSRFQVSYALPVKRAALYSVTEPQLHARHAQLREVRDRSQREAASEQMIYYVETGTALYGFILNLDLSSIGISAVTGEQILKDEEIEKRRSVAARALFRLVSGRQFGAKLSRFFPVGDVVGVVVAETEHPFSVTSPIYWGSALATARRLRVLKEKFEEEVSLTVYDALEDISDLGEFDFVSIADTPEGALASVL